MPRQDGHASAPTPSESIIDYSSCQHTSPARAASLFWNGTARCITYRSSSSAADRRATSSAEL